MNITKQLKSLLSSSYDLEAELVELVEKCFKEIFKENSGYAISSFRDDLESGMEYNGCLQGLEYYKQQVEEVRKIHADHQLDDSQE